MIQALSEIFALESMEDWKSVYMKYETLYSATPTEEVALHYAFFCWYLLWQWDEICFPGEEPLSSAERRNADTRNGISKSDLFFRLDSASKTLLTSWECTPTKYLAVLCHMKKIYPYFFLEMTFPQVMERKIFDFMREASDSGTKLICHYIRTGTTPLLTTGEKLAVENLFPKNSLIQSYFTWLFD